MTTEVTFGQPETMPIHPMPWHWFARCRVCSAEIICQQNWDHMLDLVTAHLKEHADARQGEAGA